MADEETTSEGEVEADEGGEPEPAAAEEPEGPAEEAPGEGEVPPEPAMALVAAGRWARLAWGVGVALALGGIVLLAAQVRSLTVPLAIAFIIAYLLDPVVDWFEARKVGRTPAILILLTAFLLAGLGVVVVVAPQLFRELSAVPGKLQQLLTRLLPFVETTFGVELPGTVREALEAASRELGKIDLGKLMAPAGSMAKAVYGETVSFLASLAGVVMIPVFAFYLLRDFDLITARIRELIPRSHREGIVSRFREIDTAMSSFIRGQLTVAGILAVLYSVGLVVLGVPLGLLVGLVAGLGNMVPYLGTVVGLVFATAMTLLDWQGPLHLAMVYGVFVIVQFLEGWVITPKVVGESVGLSPFVVIVSVLLFGELFGFFGILIAVPLAAILKILLRVVLEHYRASEFFRSH